MTESIYAPPKASLAIHKEAGAFYVVSTLKMTVMFLVTLGGYQLYWHYKNWRCFQQMGLREKSIDGEIWPIVRVVFLIFFAHALLEEVKNYAAREREIEFNGGMYATAMVLLMIAFNVLMMAPENSPYLLQIMLAILVVLVLNMFVYRKVQRFINVISGDPLGKTNSAFTAVNYIWITIGVVFWIIFTTGILAMAGIIPSEGA